MQAGVTPDSAEVVLTLGPPVRQRLVFQDENGKAIARTRVIFELLKLDGKSVAHEAWSRIRTTR